MFSVDALVQYRRDIFERNPRKANASTQEYSQQNLVEAHLPLVIYIARRYQDAGVDLMDLIQEGNIGLMRAAQKFDPKMGVQFSTYAAYWIKEAILSALGQRIVSVSASKYKFGRLQRLLRTQREMQEEVGQEPTLAQLAKEMETSVATVLALLNLQQGMHTMSINKPYGQYGDDEQESLADHLEDTPEHTPEHLAFLQSRNEHLQRLLKVLTKPEREVILWRYGLKDGKEYSQGATATRLKKNWDTVVSLEQRALMKMRRVARLKHLQDFLT
jgi:RNA polymerase primary sigma factor